MRRNEHDREEGLVWDGDEWKGEGSSSSGPAQELMRLEVPAQTVEEPGWLYEFSMYFSSKHVPPTLTTVPAKGVLSTVTRWSQLVQLNNEDTTKWTAEMLVWRLKTAAGKGTNGTALLLVLQPPVSASQPSLAAPRTGLAPADELITVQVPKGFGDVDAVFAEDDVYPLCICSFDRVLPPGSPMARSASAVPDASRALAEAGHTRSFEHLQHVDSALLSNQYVRFPSEDETSEYVGADLPDVAPPTPPLAMAASLGSLGSFGASPKLTGLLGWLSPKLSGGGGGPNFRPPPDSCFLRPDATLLPACSLRGQVPLFSELVEVDGNATTDWGVERVAEALKSKWGRGVSLLFRRPTLVMVPRGPAGHTLGIAFYTNSVPPRIKRYVRQTIDSNGHLKPGPVERHRVPALSEVVAVNGEDSRFWTVEDLRDELHRCRGPVSIAFRRPRMASTDF